MSHPRHCSRIAPASGTGAFSTERPCRPMLTSSRIEPMPSLTTGRSCRFAPSHATVNSAKPTAAAIVIETTAQCGTSAVSSTQTTRMRRRHEVEEAVCEDGADERSRSCRAARPGRCRRSVATRASSPSRARHDRVREQADPERREDVDELRLVLRRKRLPDRQPPRQRAEERRDDVQREREDDPAPDDEAERVEDAAPLRAAPPEQRRRDHERDDGDARLRPARRSRPSAANVTRRGPPRRRSR